MLANPLIVPNLTDVVAEFGETTSRSALLVAVIPLPGIFLALLVGFLADRFGRRSILMVCLLIFGMAGFASSLAPTFDFLLATRFLQGFGSAALMNLSIVLVADHWQGQHRTTLMGRNSAAAAICLVLVPPISGFLAEATSWRWSLGLTTFAIPLAVVVARTLPSQVPYTHKPLGRFVSELKTSLGTPLLRATLVSAFLVFSVIFGVFLTTLPIHLDQRFGLEAGARGAVLAVPAISAIPASLLLGRLSGWVSRRCMLVVSALLIAFSSFVFGTSNTLLIVVFVSFIYGLGEGVLVPTLQDMIASSVPASHRASALALWTSSIRLGQLTGPLVAGLIISSSSTEMVMIVGAMVCASIVLIWTFFSSDLSPGQAA